MPLILRGRLAWAHDWVDNPALNAIFQALPGASFVVNGAPIPTDSALASVGAGFEHVVKLNNYIVDIGANIAHYREVRAKYVNTSQPPVSTTIGVPQLARPGAVFEVEAVAILPAK